MPVALLVTGLSGGGRHPVTLTMTPTPTGAPSTPSAQVTAVVPPTPGVHPPVAGPAGWQPGDLGAARVWVPPGWTVAAAGEGVGCAPHQGELLLGAGGARSAAGAGCGVVARLQRAVSAPPVGATAATLNGYAVRRAGDRTWVPALRVVLTTPPRTPAAVLADLGPSPAGVVAAGGPPTPAPSGWHRVTWHGVSVAVPPSWPTASADLVGGCGDVFGVHTAVFLGPDQGSARLACPFSPGERPPADGVWLQAQRAPLESTVTVRIPGSGGPVVEAAADQPEPVLQFWYRRTELRLGVGTDPFVERAVLDSLRARPVAPDTTVVDACPGFVTTGMPAPGRLEHRLVLRVPGSTRLVFTPPRSSERARVPARSAWRALPLARGVRYRVFLARFSTDGAPQAHDELAWVVTGTPHVTKLGSCQPYSVTVVDARTGAFLTGDSWS